MMSKSLGGGPPRQLRWRASLTKICDIFLLENFGGPDRARTGDLLNANQAFSQLNYRPIYKWWAAKIHVVQYFGEPHQICII